MGTILLFVWGLSFVLCYSAIYAERLCVAPARWGYGGEGRTASLLYAILFGVLGPVGVFIVAWETDWFSYGLRL